MADGTAEENSEELPASKLGTKEYWDDAYSQELVNFNDTGDVGEVWFGESSLYRIVKWIKSCEQIIKSSIFLDIGCGNGILLVKLAEHGYKNLVGVDYSEGAIQLASSIAESKQVNIKYQVCDILSATESSALCPERKFDVCLDKGTYDAISLNPEDAEGCRAKYINNVCSLLASDGLFILCSCNWTKTELLSQFNDRFDFLEDLPGPSFSFGEPRGTTATEILPRLASDRRKKISQVGKVFPKTSVQEQVDGKLDVLCVGLEKDKNVSFPMVDDVGAPSSPGAEGRVLTSSLEPGDGPEVTLPVLPSVLGSRRGNCSASPDIPEPLDFLIEGESQKKSQIDIGLDTSEQVPVEVMRTNLEPLIDKLFEEDELFVQDFEDDGLNRVLFIRKMGVYVEIKTTDYMAGVVCTPLFHCPRCRDHWIEFGTVPEDCQFKRQPTRGPAIHMAKGRKPRKDFRKKKTKRRLGDIKEGFIVSGSGTVLDQIDENESDENTSRSSNPDRGGTLSLPDGVSRDYLTSDDVVLDDLTLGVIDSRTKIEAIKVFRTEEKMTNKEYIKRLSAAFGFDEEQYNNFARVNINIDIKEIVEEDLDHKTSVISRLDLSMLDNVTVKELPEKMRQKLLSMLRLQRQRKRRQMKALLNKKKTAGHDAEVDEGDTDQETDDEDTGNGDLSNNRRNSTVKRNRKRRDSQGRPGKIRGSGESMEDISDQETAERRPGYTEGRHRHTSARGRSASHVSSGFIMDSDEEELSASRSPSDVLAYKESQSRRRSRQINKAVKNRSGQPDTPFQRLGRHPMTAPSNSSSFFAYDGDSDEETWGRGGLMSRVGSSRTRASDSGAANMSDMTRGGHVTDSQSSMLRKYSRTMGSARARKDVSYSNLDDQLSYGSLGNDESIYDLEDGQSVTRPNRARRQSKLKEKGDGVKRPGKYYHSKMIDDMGQVTASFADTNMMYGSKQRLSQARISLIDANIPSPCDSTVVIKRSVVVRPASVKESSHKKKEETEKELLQTEFPQIEFLPQVRQEQGNSQSYSENVDQVPALEAPPLEAEITQISGTTSPTQAREKPKLLSKRTIQEKSKPLISLEDLNFIHRLPVSSAFTYSFYELPNQHREHNESIKKAAGRIACRKKETGHFRSKSAP